MSCAGVWISALGRDHYLKSIRSGRARSPDYSDVITFFLRCLWAEILGNPQRDISSLKNVVAWSAEEPSRFSPKTPQIGPHANWFCSAGAGNGNHVFSFSKNVTVAAKRAKYLISRISGTTGPRVPNPHSKALSRAQPRHSSRPVRDNSRKKGLVVEKTRKGSEPKRPAHSAGSSGTAITSHLQIYPTQ